MRDDLPSGTVTFLFTDVEGSTKLLHSLGAEAYAKALAEHRRVIRASCGAEGGVEVDTQGDAFFFAFQTAPGALAAAAALTESLAPGPIQVRVGLHTGRPLVTDEGYVGDDVHFAARVGASAHGGQVVLSDATRALVDGVALTDLGEHRLKDIEGAVSVYQLGPKTFPPLKTISNTNLPRPASSFVGRERELAEVLATFERGTRLLTLTGPGGSGKTRLAVEAAANLVPSYKAGVFWVGLASLRESSLVTEQIAQTLGAKDGLAEHIGEREILLLLDNLEQVMEAAPALSGLVQACPNLTIFCTSRELLRVQGEVEYAVPPLASSEAVTLFCERSGLVSSEEIAELCARLDDLPLAVELAAARTKALSPGQILERLADRLDLLKGGRDADARQQTLRATIAWSYDLLSEEEQRVFRALSVFAGGCTRDAAEEVVDAHLDTLQSLVERSLLRFANERYWMLETVREYARQRQEKAGAQGLAHRHALFYSEALDRNREEIYVRRAESLAWFDAEEDNLRAMLDHASEEDCDDAALAVFQLTRFWVPRGRYAEAHQRLRALLAEGDLSEDARALVLTSLAEVEEWLGHLQEAEAAAREAVLLGEASGQVRVLAEALHNLAWVTFRQGDAEEAVTIEERAMMIVASVDEQKRLLALHDLGGFQIAAGQTEEAREALRAAIDGARAIGYATLEVDGAIALAEIDLRARDFASAYQGFRSAVARKRRIDPTTPERGLLGLGWAALGVDRRREARVAFGEVIELLVDAARTSHYEFALATAGMASAAEAKDARPAARLRGASVRLHEVGEFTPPADDLDLVGFFERRLIDMLGAEALAEEQAEGTAMSLDEAVELARSLADT
jgi:predicted ATPase